MNWIMSYVSSRIIDELNMNRTPSECRIMSCFIGSKSSAKGVSPMKSMKLVSLMLFAITLLVPAMAVGQSANPPASTMGSGQTSGHGEPSVEQAAKGSGVSVEQEIRALEALRIEAILKGDTSFFEKYCADDYMAIRGDGKLSTKAQEIENFKAGTTKYESIDEHELKIRIYGDTAVANARSSIKATINGWPYSGDVRNTRVWVKQKGNWKLVTFHATRIETPKQ
jgi:ketosteroid isomerase-like protein